MLALDGVEVPAFYALKRHMTALRLEAGVVATVVVDPEAEKNRGDEEAIDDRGGDEVHGDGERQSSAGSSLHQGTNTD